MELYLIRHPQPAVAPGVCYGRSDLPLAEPAAVAAARLMSLLPSHYRLLSSPLRRCRELAAALTATVTFDHRLVEMDFGAWEMQAYDTLPPALIEAWAADPAGFCPPGGESARDMGQRVWAAFSEQLPLTQPLVIVAHGGPLRVITAHLLGMPETHWPSLQFAYAQVSRFRLMHGAAVLDWFNRG